VSSALPGITSRTHGVESGTLASEMLALRHVAQFLGQVGGRKVWRA
jgi:hypothetical protein